MTSLSKINNFPSDFLIGGKYKLIRMIGKGSFGEVYSGLDIFTNSEVAIKIESTDHAFSQLMFESKVYRYLADGLNIPAARLYTIDVCRKALVMELLGPSLEELYNTCKRQFSLKTVCLLADQMISLLEYIHIRYVIHRDIKPDNFLMGLGKNCNKVYIVDFGLAKQYCVSRALPHVKYNNRKFMIGTARYASINSHLGIEQSRRDDLESLGYVFLYFYLGHLPWQGLRGENKSRKYDRICEKKLNTSVEVLCKNAPVEFQYYVNYCRKLRFDERPDYMYLRQLFRELYRSQHYPFDNIFDWTVRHQPSRPNTTPVPPSNDVVKYPNPTVGQVNRPLTKKEKTNLKKHGVSAPGVILDEKTQLEKSFAYWDKVEEHIFAQWMAEDKAKEEKAKDEKVREEKATEENDKILTEKYQKLLKDSINPNKVINYDIINKGPGFGNNQIHTILPHKTDINVPRNSPNNEPRYNLRSSKKDDIPLNSTKPQILNNRYDKRRTATTTQSSNIT